ncbi:hypothetical protein HanIR_Chr01g0041151 [Helianthus annuus]|nr:hypothetical protein HanIR_Chr01g0041151 [Helianthus annuus]
MKRYSAREFGSFEKFTIEAKIFKLTKTKRNGRFLPSIPPNPAPKRRQGRPHGRVWAFAFKKSPAACFESRRRRRGLTNDV